MPYGDAQYMEVDLAIRLRSLGYGVWQNQLASARFFRRRCDFRNNKASIFWTHPPLSAAHWKNQFIIEIDVNLRKLHVAV